MSNRTDELLKHIIENPADDEARLVFADHLSGQGDPRGEFVNVQVHLAARVNPARRKKLRGIERGLLKAHGKAFVENATAAKLKAELRRGFVDRVSGSASAFAKAGADLLAVEPVQRVALKGGGDKQLAAMVKAGLLGRLRSLRMVGGSVGNDGLATLAGSEQLASLRILNLSSNEIGDEGLAALVQSPHFALDSLTLNDNEIGDDGLASVAGAPACRSLKRLFLARNTIGVDGARALLASTHLQNLRHLGLGANEDIGDAGAALFADEELARRFDRLGLEQIDVETKTAKRLRELYGKNVNVDSW